jgi:hypothetical protein
MMEMSLLTTSPDAAYCFSARSKFVVPVLVSCFNFSLCLFSSVQLNAAAAYVRLLPSISLMRLVRSYFL